MLHHWAFSTSTAIEELRIDPDVFGDTGLMTTSPVNIKIDENATPYHVYVARRVPIGLPLLPKVESELRRMKRDSFIKKITEPTPWCAQMVAALKRPDNVMLQGDTGRGVCKTNHIHHFDPSKPTTAFLTRFNKIATQGAPQMAVDKEANSLSRVYSYLYSKFNLCLFYV